MFNWAKVGSGCIHCGWRIYDVSQATLDVRSRRKLSYTMLLGLFAAPLCLSHGFMRVTRIGVC